MKICPTCNMQLDDQATFCRNCGTRVSPREEQPTTNGYESGYYQAPEPVPSPWDHTADFEARDIQQNKLFAMLIYLTGLVGILLTLLARPNSTWLQFHLRQGMKFLVAEAFVTIAALVLCWTVLVPVCAGISLAILFLLRLIGFFQVCNGKAVEPAILRSLKFMQ